MVATIEALMDGIFDYAGLFPPAKLPMPEAVAGYTRHIDGPQQAWVSRFVCPAAWLSELQKELSTKQIDEPWSIAVLGSGADAIRSDLDLVAAFRENTSGIAAVEAFEVRLGAELNFAALRELQSQGFEEIYIELPWSDKLPDQIHEIAAQGSFGVKGRTGGTEPSAYPSSDSLAEFLQLCTQLEINHKLTAGLHHPIRHQHSTMNVKEHGFLNILVALSLSIGLDLSRNEIKTILDEEDPSAFSFTDDSVGYKGLSTGLESATEARWLFASIGSCSIDEPTADLKALGLI